MSGRPAAIAAGLLALTAALAPAWAWGDTDVTAADCAVAAGRDATNNTVTCNYGLSPEQVQELTRAAAAGATGPLAATIVGLSKRLGVTEDATKTLLRIVGEQDVPLERLSEALDRVADDYKRLQAQVAALDPENPTARGLVERAKAEIKAGRFAEARALLREATRAQVAAAQQARQLHEQAQAAEAAQLLGAAASTAAEGGVAVTEGDYAQAAELYAQAAALVPLSREEVQAGYRERQADALYRQGEERGDNAALAQSIVLYREGGQAASGMPTRAQAEEVEPNDRVSQANPIEIGKAYEGFVRGAEIDLFVFEAPPDNFSKLKLIVRCLEGNGSIQVNIF